MKMTLSFQTATAKSLNFFFFFKEIMIGILGNMCSLDIVREALSQKEDVCIILLKMLSLEDSLTLIQLIRLLNTCLWSAKSSSQQNTLQVSIVTIVVLFSKL